MSNEEVLGLKTNDYVNRDAASDAPTPETVDGGSGSTLCSFSAILPLTPELEMFFTDLSYYMTSIDECPYTNPPHIYQSVLKMHLDDFNSRRSCPSGDQTPCREQLALQEMYPALFEQTSTDQS